MNLVFDRIARVLKCLAIADDATHKAVAVPDNGKEFTVRAMLTWACRWTKQAATKPGPEPILAVTQVIQHGLSNEAFLLCSLLYIIYIIDIWHGF